MPPVTVIGDLALWMGSILCVLHLALAFVFSSSSVFLPTTHFPAPLLLVFSSLLVCGRLVFFFFLISFSNGFSGISGLTKIDAYAHGDLPLEGHCPSVYR